MRRDISSQDHALTADAASEGDGSLPLPPENRSRPSRLGKALGKVLAAIADAGRMHAPPLPEMCSTCAFRDGCMTNQMGETGLIALNCVLGIDPDRFACHHGMKDSEPRHLCAGYIAALLAPVPFVKKALAVLADEIADPDDEPDEVRAEFDAWITEVDPRNTMDDYVRGRRYLRKIAAKPTSEAALAEGSAPGMNPESVAHPTPGELAG